MSEAYLIFEESPDKKYKYTPIKTTPKVVNNEYLNDVIFLKIMLRQHLDETDLLGWSKKIKVTFTNSMNGPSFRANIYANSKKGWIIERSYWIMKIDVDEYVFEPPL